MKRIFSALIMTLTTALLLSQVGCHHHHDETPLLPEHPAMTQIGSVALPHIFGDHMVLQADMRVPIWGSSAPAEAITVEFAGQTMSTRANSSGNWQLALLRMPASANGADLTVSGDHGDAVTFHDVLIGEVWLGSGQSNMERQIKQVDRAAEFIAAANDPAIRLFTVKRQIAKEPVNDVDGQWVICTPKTLPTFSAVLYHFGLDLHKRLDVPMGLIHSSWGGTPIRAWTPEAGFSSAELDQMRQTAEARPRFPSAPSVLYNGMIAPLAGYAMRGAIWYQGEADNNPTYAPDYGQHMQTMVDLWRRAWAEGTFPFYFVEIAPFGGYPNPETLPILWQQQIWFARHGKHVEMAPTGDLGDIKNIHPTNKHEVGRRLALIALANTYGFKHLEFKGPSYDESTIEGNQIRVHFSHTGGILKTCDGKAVAWFQIAGADKHFVPGKASIEGEDVIVSSDQVPDPAYVRLGWNQSAQINLCNGAGLPALQFSTAYGSE